MVQVCARCNRVNPGEAVYCFFDGGLLQGRQGLAEPGQPGRQPFPRPFVFPSGRSCANFDQLAQGCQENWAEAAGFLRQGLMENFLGGLGRADLAMAARAAAGFPDGDRGLDQLLAKLPTGGAQAARGAGPGKHRAPADRPRRPYPAETGQSWHAPDLWSRHIGLQMAHSGRRGWLAKTGAIPA